MSSTIYCERCDTHVNAQLRDIHEQACGGAGYDPYNSADRFKRSQRDARNEREAHEQLLPMFLRRQAS